MKLRKLLENVVCNVENFEDVEIENISFNSKEKNKNGIFFCLSGSKDNGEKYVDEAIENGAKVIVCEKNLSCPVPQVVVTNARKALSLISANFYENPASQLKTIAITGTNGKTTTSFITKKILEEAGNKVGIIGTNGAFIGDKAIGKNLTTPDPTFLHKYLRQMTDEGCSYVVMEASAHAIYLNKLYGLKHEVLALTNLTQDHLDFFINMRTYSSVKEKYFSSENAKNFVVNIGDGLGFKIYNKKLKNVYSYDVGQYADYICFPFSQKLSGSYLKFKTPKNVFYSRCKLFGHFNCANLACAVAICDRLGISENDIISGIQKVEPVEGRVNVFHNKARNFDVIIDYAHTPDGLEKIIKNIRPFCEGKLFCVFGCGGNRDASKRKIMGKIASKFADFSFLTSDNPRFENPQEILSQISKGFGKKQNYAIIENRALAIKSAVKFAKEGDVVIIAGKGAECEQEIAGEKFHFSDKEEVKKLFN